MPMTDVRRAMLQTLASRQGVLVAQLLGVTILARLLTPQDFGIFATTMVVFAIVENLVNFGVAANLIRRPVMDEHSIRSAFGACIMTAALLIALTIAAIGALPASYWPSHMREVLGVLILALVVQPLTVPITAILRRNLQFGWLAGLSVVGIVCQILAAAGLAMLGFGALALAAGLVAERMLTAAVLLALACREGFLYRPSFSGARQHWKFGVEYSAVDLISGVADAVVVFVIGRFLGLANVGQFGRAQAVANLVNRSMLEGIAPVVLPALTRSLREGGDPAQLYLLKVRHLAVVSWPCAAVIAILAEPLVAVLLGSQWREAATAVSVLALSGLFLPLTKMSRKVFIALDMSRKYLRVHSVYHVSRVLLAAAGALISLPFACLGVSVALGVKAILVSSALKTATSYRSRDLLVALSGSAAVTVCTVAGPALMMLIDAELADVARLATSLAAAGVGWLIGITLTGEPLLQEIITTIGLARRALARRIHRKRHRSAVPARPVTG